MDTKSPSEELDAQIVDGLSELIGRIISRGERLARDLGIPSYFIKVLHTLNCPMAMKELGQRIHCDPLFQTHQFLPRIVLQPPAPRRKLRYSEDRSLL